MTPGVTPLDIRKEIGSYKSKIMGLYSVERISTINTLLVVLIQYRRVMDGQTDGIAVGMSTIKIIKPSSTDRPKRASLAVTMHI